MASYRKIQYTNQIKENLALFLNSELLDRGYWQNIASGQKDHNQNDLSRCIIDTTDSSYPSGYVWKAPRANWIYETDISLPSGVSQPTTPSGVWIDGVWKAKTDSTYGHVFDYKNGRIIFTSGTKVPASKRVQVKYAHKEFSLFTVNQYQAHKLHNDYFVNDGIEDDEFPFNKITVPAIHIEMDSTSMSPLAVGGGKILSKGFIIHIITNDDRLVEAEDIADTLSLMEDETITLIDINKLPERVNWRGDKASTYVPYKTLRANSTYFWSKMYLPQMNTQEMPTEKVNYHRIRVLGLGEIRDITE